MNEELRKRAEEWRTRYDYDWECGDVSEADKIIRDLLAALDMTWEAACRAQQLQDAAFVTISLDWKQAWLAPMPENDLSQPADPIVADPGNLKK